MKPTHAEFTAAMKLLAAIPFFPADEDARSGIVAVMAAMIDRKDRLDWLVWTMINRVKQWPGPSGMRDLYCTKYKPADGDEGQGWCDIAGFTPGDSERQTLFETPKTPEYSRVAGGEDPEFLKRIEELDKDA